MDEVKCKFNLVLVAVAIFMLGVNTAGHSFDANGIGLGQDHWGEG
jgi:hypothetical protein